ncbi:MAG: head-tail connector protein, partial [Prevotella sp.]|nr:head-tail connector protein [Prevotella sp.]
MKYLTIDDIKQQLRLDFDCEDALLELYGQGAEDTVLYLCNRTYENLVGTYGEVPAAIRQVTLELVTNSYEQRSPASPTNLSAVPYNFDLLVKEYIVLHGTPLKNERN